MIRRRDGGPGAIHNAASGETARRARPGGRGRGPVIRRLGVLTRWQRFLLAAFLLVGIATGIFGARAVVSAIYWSQHRDDPIVGWMTIGYVAHSHDVPPQVLQQAIGLPTGVRDRRPLSEIAAAEGRSLGEVVAMLEAAIAAERAAGGGGAPP